MSCDREPGSSTAVIAGPYRERARPTPAAGALLAKELSAARRAQRREVRVERRLTWLAVAGYIAAAFVASPAGEERSCGSQTVALTCVAAGATCAMFLAGRAGARSREIQAEVAGIERLSAALARGPRG